MKDRVQVNGVAFYSQQAVARKLGVSVRSVERWRSTGQLQCGHAGGHPMISEIMLREFLETPRSQDQDDTE